MAPIKAIDSKSVHQLQSGQVIVDLLSVVKELVENALDAGSTSVEVRFRQYGLESIEVQDNGSGIAAEDYPSIALKHYTSKLESYDDLDRLVTFGFRGEAISSLCAVSSFSITTAQENEAPKGTKLEFDFRGGIKNRAVVAFGKGTAARVESLFKDLPVRRRDLERNIKREYGKVLVLLNAYACISTSVKFTVGNQDAKGKKIIAFATKANQTTQQNIASVFGIKALANLMPLDLDLVLESTERVATGREENGSIHVAGHISRPAWGEGRQAPDRQMFFVNGRPCNLPQVVKAINEVYKSFNASQTPFIFADFRMNTNAYDVNVSPDKRSIMLHNQTAMLDSLKATLSKAFESTDQSMPQMQLSTRRNMHSRTPATEQRSSSDTDIPVRGEDRPEVASSTAQSQLDADEGPSSSDFASIGARFASSNRLLRNSVNSQATTRRRPTTPGQSADNASEVMQHFKGVALPRPLPDGGQQDALTGPNGPVGDHPLSPISSPTPSSSSSSSSSSSPLLHGSSPYPLHIMKNQRSQAERRAERDAGEESEMNTPHLPSWGLVTSISESNDPIPAIQSSALFREPVPPVQNAFDRMRGFRTQPTNEPVTVTIGGHTSYTQPGGPAPKRRKVNYPIPSTQGLLKSKQLLVSHLRGFRAPGGQDSHSDNPNTTILFGSNDHAVDASLFVQDTRRTDEDDRNQPLNGILPGDDNADDEEMCDHQHDDHDPQSDDDYADEAEKRMKEDERVARMLAEAEAAAAAPTEDAARRAKKILRSTSSKVIHQTCVGLSCQLSLDTSTISQDMQRVLVGQSSTPALEQQQSESMPIDPAAERGDEFKKSEERLNLIVNKEDFSQMRVAGQFNLGFIIAVRPARAQSSAPTASRSADELFIIDQHASDEIRNFERLSNEVVIKSQCLLSPRPLELTATDEEIVFENLEIFAANGWKVLVRDEDREGEPVRVGSRCWLAEVPMNKGWTFTDGDFSELVALCADRSGSSSHIPRPTKVRRIVAMKACRSSIMIGKALTSGQMKGVIERMSGLNKPWRCPHGRPTMRHLTNLSRIQTWSGDLPEPTNDDIRDRLDEWYERENMA